MVAAVHIHDMSNTAVLSILINALVDTLVPDGKSSSFAAEPQLTRTIKVGMFFE